MQTLIALLVLAGSHVLPNLKLTPGLARNLTTEQVCSIKWGKDARHVTPKMKRTVCELYGIRSGCPGPGYEIDHLISRELGGADDVRNLWPEPEPDAHVKDVVENRLHRAVCSHQMTLAAAQDLIRSDWTRALVSQ